MDYYVIDKNIVLLSNILTVELNGNEVRIAYNTQGKPYHYFIASDSDKKAKEIFNFIREKLGAYVTFEYQ